MRGQLSLEMLVVTVIIIGMVLLLAAVISKSANKAADKVTEKTDAALNASDTISAKGATGGYCVLDSDCLSGFCDKYESKCT